MKLKRGTPAFTGLLGLGLGILVLLVTQFVLPGAPGSGRGTPWAINFQALVSGALNGMIALGLVLVYRSTRVINFAQAALGALGAIFAYNLIIVYRVPYGIAMLGAVVMSVGVTLFFELLIMRRFFEAPRLVLTILTIGIGAVASTQGLQIVGSLPIWGEGRDVVEGFGGAPVRPWGSLKFNVGDLSIPFGFSHILTLVMLVVVLVGLGAFFRYTKVGVAVRATVENTERAELLGINVRMLSTIVWGISGALAAISITLLGTNTTFVLGGRGAPSVLISALAAAVIARMRSMPIAVYAALLISILQSAVLFSYQDQQGVVESGLFVVIALGLLLQRKTLQRGEERAQWEATQEVRPTPREMLDLPALRNWRLVLMAIAGIGVLVFPFTTSSGIVNRGSFAAISAIVLLSLVVLTGWAGQVSLGQFALVAVGALVGGGLTSRAGWSFWLALPVGAIVTALVALVIGLPALRIRGLFLGVVTLAFASAVYLVAFSERYFDWLQPENIRRPTLPLIDFEDERSMYYLCLFFLVAMIALVVSLRRSRPGRVMIAMRENENDLQAFGINVVRTKLSAFVLGGFICGIAGVLFAHHQRAVTQSAFTADASIDIFAFGVIGGIGSVSGAILGAAFQAGSQFFPSSDPILGFFLNRHVILIFILFIAPGGLAQIVYAVRDSVLRIVAQRRQMVVPALFADVDPDVLERRLIPLSEPEERAGMRAIANRHDYRLDSTLYHQEQVGTGGERAPDERAALAEVADRVGTES
jgi:branched-chain amino acid transport system permease protein